MSLTVSQATKARLRLRYKRVVFHGTAIRGFRKIITSYTHFPFRSTHLAYHKPYLRVRAILLHSSDTCPASVGFLLRYMYIATTQVRSHSVTVHDLKH